MDNRIGIALAAALSVIIVVMVVGFIYLQGEINSLKPPVATPQPTSIEHPYTSAPAPTGIRTTQPTQNSSHLTTVYTWYLKPGLMGNETWLKEMVGFTGAKYDSTKSWSDNYVAFISSIWEVPQFVKDSDITGLVGAALIEHLPVTTTYDDSTGYTRAAYQYEDGIYHVIESSMPHFAVNGEWTREDV